MKKNKRRVLYACTILVIILFGAFLYDLKNQVFSYSQKNSREYVHENVNGEIYLRIPVEFDERHKNSDQFSLGHRVSKFWRHPTTLIAYAESTTQIFNNKYYEYFNTAITGDNKDLADAATSNIKLFMTKRLPADSKLTLDGARKVDLQGAEAWSFDMSITLPKASGVGLKGKLLYMVDGKTFRYLSIYTTPKNWAANSSYWDGVLQGIKITQNK